MFIWFFFYNFFLPDFCAGFIAVAGIDCLIQFSGASQMNARDGIVIPVRIQPKENEMKFGTLSLHTDWALSKPFMIIIWHLSLVYCFMIGIYFRHFRYSEGKKDNKRIKLSQLLSCFLEILSLQYDTRKWYTQRWKWNEFLNVTTTKKKKFFRGL